MDVLTAVSVARHDAFWTADNWAASRHWTGETNAEGRPTRKKLLGPQSHREAGDALAGGQVHAHNMRCLCRQQEASACRVHRRHLHERKTRGKE